jgi:hypothetical protein
MASRHVFAKHQKDSKANFWEQSEKAEPTTGSLAWPPRAPPDQPLLSFLSKTMLQAANLKDFSQRQRLHYWWLL